MNTLLMIVNGALTLLLAVVILYMRSSISAYGAEKGKNLATHEDIQKLVDQVAAVTKTTKEIETTIADASWSRHVKWEIKRDVIFGVLKETKPFEDVLIELLGSYKHPIDDPDTHQEKVFDKFENLRLRFRQASLLATVICSKELTVNLYQMERHSGQVAERLLTGHIDGAEEEHLKYTQYSRNLRDLIRKELEVE